MRLTLRTLLAYMDDILDPADQEELGRKIESSPFATELIHRSRDTVRRARLSAPDPLAGADDDIHGSDANFDANTVSEYLDNTLPPEAVAEFERGCLEAGVNADMLLAEASSCHHILTMVLGEPAEVDADLRQRMYALAESPAAAKQLRVEPGHQPAPQPEPTAPAAVPLSTVVTVGPTAATAAREEVEGAREVPDYIRAAARERRRNRQLAGAFVAALLLGGVATWLFWPQGAVEEPGRVAALGGTEAVTQGPEVADVEVTDETATSDATADAAAVDPDSEAPAFVPNVPPVDEADEDTAVVEVTPPADVDGPAVPDLPAGEETEMAAAPAAGGTENTNQSADAGDPGSTVMAPTLEAGVTPDVAAADAAALAPPAPTADEVADGAGEGPGPMTTADAPQLPPELPAGGATEPQTVAEPAAPGPNLISDAAPASTADRAAAPAAANTATPAEPEAPATAGEATADAAQVRPVGNYLGANDMLLRQGEDGAWLRVSPRTPLLVNEKLLALPAFRTLVVLADMNVYLTGGAEIDLLPTADIESDEPIDVALHVPYGQVILNAGLNGNTLFLSMVDQERVINLGPSASLAVQVRRIFQPGGATQRTPAPAEVSWYLTSGTLTRGDGTEIDAPATWTTITGEDSTAEPIDEVPAWVDRDPLSTLERGARDRVAEALLANEPVGIKLLELSDKSGLGRRIEVRTLAARSGTYVDVFDPTVRALADVDQRAFWKSHIDMLRSAIAREPSATEGIHEALATNFGQDAADDLMEMLLGFDQAAVGTTREEVQNGVLVRLLRWMENDDLVYRVLALHNVNDITGTTNLGGYRPEQTAQQRERAMRFYWQALENGDLIRK